MREMSKYKDLRGVIICDGDILEYRENIIAVAPDGEEYVLKIFIERVVVEYKEDIDEFIIVDNAMTLQEIIDYGVIVVGNIYNNDIY